MEVLMTANHIGPFDGIVPQQEAPVRLAALRLQARPVFVSQLQRGTVVDWRQSAPQKALALQRQFFSRLVAGIKPAGALQRFHRQIIAVQPVGLAGGGGPLPSPPRPGLLPPRGGTPPRPPPHGIVPPPQ